MSDYLSQSKQCLARGQREQIKSTIANFEKKWQREANKLSQAIRDRDKANANVNQYTQPVKAIEIDLRFLESYKPRNRKEKRQQELDIQRSNQNLLIANTMLTVAQNDVRRLNREIESINKVMDGISSQIRIGQRYLQLPDCNRIDIPCEGPLSDNIRGVGGCK